MESGALFERGLIDSYLRTGESKTFNLAYDLSAIEAALQCASGDAFGV